ncbi:hypothetical protein GCM10023088_48930 [Actinomadura verrucosospora]|uniref:hypothetical protein n=1 Tax=Actinomadura verrucosospora TaxID=46165 RepID=UPI0031F01A84
MAVRPGLLLIGDKGFKARCFEDELAHCGIELLRPSMRSEPDRPAEPLLKPVRRLIESVNDTLKGQLDLERHGGPPSRASRSESPSASWP